MEINYLQFHKKVYFLEFIQRFRTVDEHAAALESNRWLDSYHRVKRGGTHYFLLKEDMHTAFKCSHIRQQTSLITDTIFQGIGFPLPLWFLNTYLINQSKRKLDWRILSKAHAIHAGKKQGTINAPHCLIQVYDTNMGSDACATSLGVYKRKVLFVTDLVVEAMLHIIMILKRNRKPKEQMPFSWYRTVLSKTKNDFCGTYYLVFKFRKNERNYLSTITYRFNHRFNRAVLSIRLVFVDFYNGPQPES